MNLTTPSVLAIDGGTPVRAQPLPARQPFSSECERLALAAIRSGNLYGINGVYTPRFEQEFAQFYGAGDSVACSSGTAAIQTALAAFEPEPGSEVITAPITDAGSVIPILALGCIPVFADLGPGYGMDPDSVESLITDRTFAIVAVHLFGGASDSRRLREVADRHHLVYIEDCSQAHATTLGDRYLGRFGHASAFSLQQSKHMTTGDGGMAVTDDPDIARRMRLYRDKGWNRTGFGSRSYESFGMNFRMTELQAAVGIPQLGTLTEVIGRRRQLAQRIDARLAGLPGVRRFEPLNPEGVSYWAYPFEVPAEVMPRFGAALAAEGVPNTPGYIGEPIYLCMSAVRDRQVLGTSRFPFGPPFHEDVSYSRGLCPVAEAALGRLIVFWLHEGMGDDDVDSVGEAIAKVATALVTTEVPR